MSTCPSLEELRRFLASDMLDSQEAAVEIHIDQCAACQKVLDTLTDAAGLQKGAPAAEVGPDVNAETMIVTPAPAAKSGAAFLRDLRRSPPTEAVPRRHENDATDAGEPALPDTAKAPLPPPLIPGYIVVKELGRGGMGVVYLARQLDLNRLVAIKMILRGIDTTASEGARFHAEAATIARVHHANIVQIYEVGDVRGHPFIVLEYVEGGTLADKIDGKPLPSSQAIQIVAILAEALQTVHQRGVLHRDLKPGNILLTADGIPKITDFGLAKQVDADGSPYAGLRTRTGVVIGTPSYMSPEQASGNTKTVGPAADIYALGAILYELLTGRPPFLGETAMATLSQVLSADPVPPRRLQPRLERDLETVCLKCLQKEPQRRYLSSQDLADDLRRI